MAHTQQSVLKALGKEAQVSGGAIVVYRGGKHIAVSKFVEGEFVITPEGLELLDSPQITTDEGVDVVVNGRGSKPKGGKKDKPEVVDVPEVVTEAVEDEFELDLSGLDLGGNE